MKSLGWLGIALLMLVALALAAVQWGLPAAARSALDSALAANDLAPARYAVLEVGLGRARIEGLAIGLEADPDLALDRAEAEYGLLDLLRGRVHRVQVEGLRVRATQSDAGWSFGALDAALAGDGGDAATAGLPVEAVDLTLTDVRALLTTIYGDVSIPLDGRIQLTPEQVEGELRFAVEHTEGRSEGTLRIGPGALDDLDLAIVLRGERPSLQADATLRLRGEGDAAELAGRITAKLRDLRLPAPEGSTGAGLDLARFELEAEGSGPLDALRGTASVSLAGGAEQDGARVRGVTADARIRWQRDAEGLAVHLEECAHVALRELALAGFALEEPIALCVEPAPQPLLHAPSAGAETGLTLAAALPSTTLRGRIGEGSDALRVRADTPHLNVRHHAALGDQPARSEVSLSDGAIELPDLAVRAQDLTLQAELIDGVLSGAFPFSIGRVEDLEAAPRFPPLAVAGTLRPERDSVRVLADLRGPKNAFRAALDGLHHTATGKGHANVSFAPLQFAPGGLAPSDVLPALGEWVSQAEGEAHVRGVVRWGGDAPSSEGVLLIEDMRVVSPLADIERLNTALHLDSLFPPATPAHQLVAMAQLSLGLVLSDGLIDFQLRPDGVLVLAAAEWRLADGRIFAEGEFDPSAPEPGLTLQVEDLQLARLLEVLEVDGLTGEGLLDGRIPVTLRDGSAWIEDGRLVAREPGGVLRYRPAGQAPIGDTPAGGMDLARKALENFQYHTLEISLEGDAGGELALRLHLAGANPELYDGYPIELNVNVTGKFSELVNQSLTGYRVPDVIQQRLSAFGADAP